MATVQRFEELKVWQDAIQLDQRIWEMTRDVAFRPDSSLREQILRSGGSVADNIAEGFERGSKNEFLRFLTISKGSAGEVRSQLHRCRNRRFIADETFTELYRLADQIGGKIRRLSDHLNRSEHKGVRYKVNEPESLYETLTNYAEL